ncbi:disease resistance family protein/LRR family protein [Abeliophyllum distichum]|uniref:Disease resistance family protein/LRR family protein n=1 Tax=Abeliophyllum distichum TaxID=126358 RepID=A0ABD1SYM2_9LAMI
MCIERERQALLKFKHGLIDDDDVLSSWGSGKDKKECCNWLGIKCNEFGRVIKLDLNLSNAYMLRGKVSPALLELQHLNYLDLSSLDFGGSQIPNFIGYIKNLTVLSLQNSNLTGNIPCQLGNLTNLEKLILNGNNGLRVKNVEWLSRLSSLTYLDLTGVNLNETNWLPQIMKLRLLNSLTLSDCQLHDNTLSAIDFFVNSSFSSLYFIDLSKNYLTSSFIFQWLFNFSRYAYRVDLSGNQLDGPIPDAFGELISLHELNLMENMLHGGIPKSLGNLSHLRSIDISYNQLSGPFPDITRFSSLTELILNNNQLRGFIPQSLGQASSLKTLYLSHNQIGGKILSNLSVFSLLYRLYLDSNSMEGTITEDHLSNFTKLVRLDLSFNSLYLNFSSDWVPPFYLEVLRLKHCNLGYHFPKWLQTQKGLFELDMSFASISDTLPNWLWSVPHLESLNLSHNNIGGRIPDFLPALYFFDFSYNNLSGPIPLSAFNSMEVQLSKNMFSGSISHICRIPDNFVIRILDLSDNQLSGELPDCWMNQTDLIVLNLANNRFCGKIPYTLGALDQLQTLHLRNNSLIGDLPSSLKNCMELRIIDLGENKLTGNIPAWIGTHLRKLTIVSLRFNKFQGNIPPTICQLTNIQILDLSRNNLSGKILQCVNNFTSMVHRNSSAESTEYIVPLDNYVSGALFTLHIYFDHILIQWKGKESEHGKLGLVKGIDLSSNKLVGTIPQQFSDMRGLVFLNLSRNHLTGNIISNIGQMETLEWLDLSRNQLSGEIPNSLAVLHFLSVLDLSYNNLTGKIPLSTQLQSFNSSAYAGNNGLCGLPLVVCPEDPRGPCRD